jgi:hypothetical protein
MGAGERPGCSPQSVRSKQRYRPVWSPVSHPGFPEWWGLVRPVPSTPSVSCAGSPDCRMSSLGVVTCIDIIWGGLVYENYPPAPACNPETQFSLLGDHRSVWYPLTEPKRVDAAASHLSQNAEDDRVPGIVVKTYPIAMLAMQLRRYVGIRVCEALL